MSDVEPQVRERLLRAWHGEIEAGAAYELIAKRLPAREAEVLRKLAATEAGHRGRLEGRMQELGIEIPDPSTVKLSWWARMQARVAPVDKLLAAREAAEDDEVDDLYNRPTGDTVTDRLLHEIRMDERGHSRTVGEMRVAEGAPMAATGAAARAGSAGTSASTDGEEPRPVPMRASGTASVPVMLPGQRAARQRLDKILGREKWHVSSGGWISGAIYGANDGLASVFGIVAGVAGATDGSSFVLTAGAAGAIASALSMATGAYLAERSEAEVAEANIARERGEIATHPEEEIEELSLFYQLKGIDEQTAATMARQLSKSPDAFLNAIATEEFGTAGHDGANAIQASVSAGISTGLGAMIPVIPFIFIHGALAIAISAAVSLAAHFLVGAAKSLVTLRSWWGAGFEMTLAGVVVGGATYLVGLALPT